MKKIFQSLPIAITAIIWLMQTFVSDGGVGAVNGLVVFFIIWWLCLFIMLPIGVHSQEEAGDVFAGSEPGAPVKAMMKKKMWWTTIAASVFWLIYFLVMYFSVLERIMPSYAS